MNESDRRGTQGSDAAKAVGGFAVELVAGLGVALVQFVVLGLILAGAGALVLFVNATLGLVVGVVGFLVWTYKTGWTFW